MAKEHKQVYSGSRLIFENTSGDVGKFQVDVNGNLVVTGNLNILGDLESTDVTQSTLQIDDKSIILNRGELGPGVGATPGTSPLSGLIVDRGMYEQTGTNDNGEPIYEFRDSPYTPATVLWNEIIKAWDFNTDLVTLDLDGNPNTSVEWQDRFTWTDPRLVNIGDPEGDHRTSELETDPLLRGTAANVGWVADITNTIEINIDNLEEYLNTAQSKTDNHIMYWRSNNGLRYGGSWSTEELRIFYDKSPAFGGDVDTNGYDFTYFGNYKDTSATSSRATKYSNLYLGDTDGQDSEYDNTTLWAQNDLTIESESSILELFGGTEVEITTPLADINATTEFDLTTPLADINATTFDLDGTTSNINSSTSFTLQTPLADINATTEFDLTTPLADINATTFDANGSVADHNYTSSFTVTSPDVNINATTDYQLIAPLVDINATTEFQLDTPLADINATTFDYDGSTFLVDASSEAQITAPTVDVNATTTYTLDTPTATVNATTFDLNSTNVLVDATTEIQLTAPTVDVNASTVFTLDTPLGDFNVATLDIDGATSNINSTTSFTVTSPQVDINAGTQYDLTTPFADINATTFDADGSVANHNYTTSFDIVSPATTVNAGTEFQLDTPLADINAVSFDLDGTTSNINSSTSFTLQTPLADINATTEFDLTTPLADINATTFDLDSTNIFADATTEIQLTAPTVDVNANTIFTLNTPNGDFTVTDLDVTSTSYNHVTSTAYIDASTSIRLDAPTADLNFSQVDHDGVNFTSTVSGTFTVNGTGDIVLSPAGSVTINDYVMPGADGSAGQSMITDGNGNVTFQTAATEATALETGRNIAVSGAVTGSAFFDGTTDITIATTATSDPTLTLAGDATGSATFTNLGNATLTVTVLDDSHRHVASNIDNFAEEVEDVVGGMVTGNTENGITVTYQDADGTLDFNVNDPVITLTGDVSGSATMTNLSNTTISVTVADDSHNHVISNVDGLQSALNAKADDSTVFTAGLHLSGGGNLGANRTFTLTPATNNYIVDNQGNQRMYFGNDTNTTQFINRFSSTGTHQWRNSGNSTVATIDHLGNASFNNISANGSNLTNINANNITSGTVNDARLPGTISSNITGNAATATRLATARTISLGGELAGSASFNGTSNITISASINNFTERTQDVVGGMVSGGVEDGISVTYNDSAGVLNFDIDNTVVRTTGNQDITGNKFFQSEIESQGFRAGREAEQHVNIWGEAGGNFIQSVSRPTNSKGLTINATTNTGDDAIVSGTSFIELQVLGQSGLRINSNADVSMSNDLGVSGVISGNGSGLTNLNANNITTGTISDARLPNTISSSITGNSATATRVANSISDGTSVNAVFTSVGSDGAGIEIGSTGTDQGYLEIFTQDNGSEPIYVRQYQSGSVQRTATLLNGVGNTIFPNNVTAASFSGNGSTLTALNAGNITSGTINDARLPNTISSSITGNAATASNAQLLDNINSTQFLRSDQDDIHSSNLTVAGELLTSRIRTDNSTEVVINVGESNGFATGQGAEILYVNAEGGLQVNASPDNWGSGWAGRVTTNISATGITWNGNTVWHSGNDGPGSGLSADLFDNLNSSQFLRSDTSDTMSGNLTVTGTVTAGSFNTSSALKYKDNVVEFDNALDKVMQIDTIYYTPKTGPDKSRKIGVSAESLAKVAPEFVNFVNDEPDSVNYGQMTAMLIRAIQEQEERRMVNKIKKLAQFVISWFIK